MSSLEPLVSLARQNSDLLAGVIASYQYEHHLSDEEMVEYLDLPDIHHLYLLCLCQKPPSQIPELVVRDVGRIALYIRCNARALLRVVTGQRVHLKWQDDQKGVWICKLPPHHAVITVVKGTPATYAAYADGPNGKSWAPHTFRDLGNAQDWCESALTSSSSTASES